MPEKFIPGIPLDGKEDMTAPPIHYSLVIGRQGRKGGVDIHQIRGISELGGGFDCEVERLGRNLHAAVDDILEGLRANGWTPRDAVR